MYSRSVREISPSDQPSYRPKVRTLPEGLPGGGPAAPEPSAVRIVASYPPPLDDRPLVQSRDTVSGGLEPPLPTAPPTPPAGVAPAVATPLPPTARPVASASRRSIAACRARWRSNAARRVGSPMTSQAALIAAIRAASSGPLFMSGWYLRASRRYAAAMTSSSASGSTWSVLYGSAVGP